MQMTATRLILIYLLALLAIPASAAITVDSVTTMPSRCATDGEIQLYAHSSTSMVYAIVSGPDIRPPQSGRLFAALPRGVYQILITNFSSDSAYVSATVGGSYTFPDFAPTYADPFCAGTATGMIVGNALPQGTPPFTWTITALATGATSTQSSDTFTGLPAGAYSIRQTDSCQSFATRSITLADPVHNFDLGNINNEMWACDTAQVYMQLYLPGGNYAAPYTIQVQTHNGTYQHVITNMAYGGWYPDFRERVPGVTYGDYINLTVTDACGFSRSIRDVLAPFNPSVAFSPRTDSCGILYSIYTYLEGYIGQPDVYATYMHGPVTMTLSDPVTGAFIDSTITEGDTLRRSSFLSFSPYLPSGHSYRLTVTDGCGNTFSNIYPWPVIPAPYVNSSVLPWGCYDSTATFALYFYNMFYNGPTLELLSGPSSIHSTKPGYIYRDTIIYPQTFPVFMGSTTAVGSFVHGASFTNLGVGTYTYAVHDSCGNSYAGSFTITPQDVSDLHHAVSITKGCPGQNTINLDFGTLNYISYATVSNSTGLNHFVNSAIDTVRNLNAGTYYLTVQYYNISAPHVNRDSDCYLVIDTIVIPPYQVPVIDYATQIKCHGLVNVGLLPDSSRGVAPYAYEIIGGPQTAPMQISNFFTLTQPGTYTARISDVCGFARTFTFFVDTLSFQQVVKVGSSCVGNTATLFSQHSPYATYHWQRPGGGTYTGDSLRLSPVLPGDYGVYHIMKVVVVNNCRDTFYTTYTLAGNTIVNYSATICSGDSFRMGSRIYYSAGTYADTISASGCDSITVLQLAVRTGVYDTLSRTICPGQSVSMAGHIYTVTGTYYDTIPAPGCDTIRTLVLQVNGLRRDSSVLTICAGQSATVGAHVYSSTGIYRDTFATSGCDSVHILDLHVDTFQRTTIVRNICTGDNITINGHVYTSTGVYNDTIATAPCGLIITTDLRVSAAARDSVAQVVCAGQSISVGTHTYTATGIYRDTFATSGCDSIHILNLTVQLYGRDSLSRSICAGGSLTVGSHTYTTTGVYRDTIATAGCDSIYILNLLVQGYIRDSISRSICTGQSVAVGSHIYTSTGIYRDTFATTGCDSIFILDLHVGAYQTTVATTGICAGQSIVVGVHSYSAAGVYRDTFATAGCDSIYELHLSVSAPVVVSERITICSGSSVVVGSHTYTASGTYGDTLTAVSGCDSIHLLSLVVNTGKRDTSAAGFCAGGNVTLGGVTYTQPGSYSDTIGTAGCDSVHTLIVVQWTPPSVHIGTSAGEVTAGDTVQLSVSGQSGWQYHWTSDAVLSDSSITDPLAIISQPSWVTVHVTDTNSCTASDSLYIRLGECDGSVFVPNAFTPNGDGINDGYRIYGRCIRLNSLKIFNRWGEKVWETEDINDTWDGTYRGAKQPPEVYVYLLTYSADRPGGAISKHTEGSITLIR